MQWTYTIKKLSGDKHLQKNITAAVVPILTLIVTICKTIRCPNSNSHSEGHCLPNCRFGPIKRFSSQLTRFVFYLPTLPSTNLGLYTVINNIKPDWFKEFLRNPSRIQTR